MRTETQILDEFKKLIKITKVKIIQNAQFFGQEQLYDDVELCLTAQYKLKLKRKKEQFEFTELLDDDFNYIFTINKKSTMNFMSELKSIAKVSEEEENAYFKDKNSEIFNKIIILGVLDQKITDDDLKEKTLKNDKLKRKKEYSIFNMYYNYETAIIRRTKENNFMLTTKNAKHSKFKFIHRYFESLEEAYDFVKNYLKDYGYYYYTDHNALIKLINYIKR
jgi:hypothetical protein